ncbi:MAG: ADP-ribosylation factor family protein [Promethearchaeota archaeon]
MRFTVLSYFHTHRGPTILHALPDGLNEGIIEDICRTLDFLEETGFFVQHKGNYKTANWYFEIPSKWARGKEDMVLVSIVIIEDDTDPMSLKAPLEHFVEELKKVNDLYCAFYEGVKEEKERIKKAQSEAKTILAEFKDSLPREIPPGEKDSLKLFVFGLDRAGKTSILSHLQQGTFIKTQPTLRANIMRMLFSTAKLVVYDMAGQKRFRNSWQMHLKKPHMLIFVVDSTDKDRFEEASKELWQILESPKSGTSPLLVLANKSDLSDVESTDSITAALQLETIKNRETLILETSAKTGSGVDTAFNWIIKTTLGI